MIHGLFLDPRTWAIDFTTSPFWNPEKYGVKINLHPSAYRIPELGINSKYKFVIASEVWELPMQRTLDYLRNKGLKVLLVPREIAPTKAHGAIMFNFKKFRYKNQCYFTPDIVLAAGSQYAELWEGKAPGKTIGYPRFDVYLDKTKLKTKDQILKRHGIEKNKKIIFFPAYPPYHLQTVNGQSVTVDLYDDLQNTLKALEKYALSHPEVQVISKIHPISFKCYKKGAGSKKEVAGLLKKYYEKPTKYMKVIGDIRNDSSVAREMIVMADVVVGYTSTMLLESIIVGKPTLHLKFKQCRALKNALEFANDITTIYEPEELPGALKREDKLLENNLALVEKYLYKIDGQFCKRLCDTIKELS